MMPAVMPAESWSPASEGPTVSTEVPPCSKAIGRAPYRRLVARLLALDSVKLPLICALPFGITPLNVGAEMTLPSRTTANCSCEPAMARERSAKTCLPSPPRVRSTCHCTWPCGMPAQALCEDDGLALDLSARNGGRFLELDLLDDLLDDLPEVDGEVGADGTVGVV